ncbi:MAG TPA: ATP-binding protein [Chthoniobacteraceae bacterium]|nr:ATP-binding protein [Chthoniobacteraceae bacterium]
MRKSLWIFLLAVLVPSAVLGWLALRSAEEQKIILERRTLELYQNETQALANAARSVVDEQRRSFNDTVRNMLAQSKPTDLAVNFSAELPQAWPVKAIGFTIGHDGQLLSPSPRAAASQPDWQKFLWDQGSFLGGDIKATVYTVPVEALAQSNAVWNAKRMSTDAYVAPEGKSRSYTSTRQEQAPTRESSKSSNFAVKKVAPAQAPNEKDVLEMKMKFPEAKPEEKLQPEPSAPAVATRSRSAQLSAGATTPAAPAPAAPKSEIQPNNVPDTSPSQTLQLDETEVQRSAESQNSQLRQVQPQQMYSQTIQPAWSAIAPETTEFRLLCEGLEEGIVTRFVQDKLALIFWLRPPQAPNLIFGCVLDAGDLKGFWPRIMPEPHLNAKGAPEFVLALLDDKIRPVSTSPADQNSRDWKRPFVANEIGEALPHWEAALYLMRPEQLQESAVGLRRTLTFLIVGMLGAIALGGWLVVADARRQFALAQQKTDFVSNVSHELKTPLTSIRMFAELMLGGREETKAKSPQYLRIIMVEAERLTRLINNVLDFAKLERRQKRFDKKPLDLHAMIERIWESNELHLRESGFTTRWQAAAPPYPVIGDEDALAQILVNLLSNAEKYSGDQKEVDLQTYFDDRHVCIAVLDRGHGVPAGEERKIFEAFYRAHDSLSSGIQGSGLGLTLAQRLAQEHGGSIEYRPREGGGSAFTLKLPLARDKNHSYS